MNVKLKLKKTIYCTFCVSGVFIVAAKRTPFGSYGGKFVKTSSTELQTVAAKAALAAGNVDPKIVDSVIIGNVLMVSSLSQFYTCCMYIILLYIIFN